ncbi:MAG: spermidine synthase-like protein [Acidobacteriota bacterium]|nr:spermidine synthase-like protein [Acidobacteriota bacterium]
MEYVKPRADAMPFPGNGRLLVAIGLVSMAIIAFQICLMEILSIVQWHHFGSTIISIALLGFGASGTGIALAHTWLASRHRTVLPVLMLLCSVAMAASVGVAQSPPLRFDSFLLFAERAHAWRFVATCLVFLAPFFFGAAAIGLVFTIWKQDIGRLYAANLLGSGLGGPLALVLMTHGLPEVLPAWIAILPLLAGALLIGRRPWALAACFPLLLVAWLAYRPPALVLSQFKALSKTLDLPGSKVLSHQNSPFGLMDTVASPSLRYAPGLSLAYQDPLPATRGAFLNGDWFGALLPWEPGDGTCLLDHTTQALPYVLAQRSKVLILDAGTGEHVVQALARGAEEVQAVEPNPLAVALLEQGIPAGTRLKVHRTSSRTFLARDASRHDLIVLPMIDASGLHALNENHLLTLEAMAQMFHRLTPGGALAVSCWLDYPPRNSLKLLATMVQALEHEGLDPGMHVAAVRGWGTLTLLAKRSPLQAEDTLRIRRFCEEMAFDPAILPGLRPLERARFHALQDDRWFTLVDAILARAPVSYEFNIAPASDNQPYFSQFLTWKSLAHLKALYGGLAVPFFELSYLILILSTLLIILLALPLIFLPWMKKGEKKRLSTVIYFGGIGTGYMFMEIALIQRFVLYLGHPIHAAAAVISLLLVFSGWGSLASAQRLGSPRFILAGITALILLYALILAPTLAATISLPLAGRMGLTLGLIAPLAFWMGMPFPLGLSRVSAEQAPWAWGINGCLSVITAPLANILAVELGFAWVMALAASAYAAAALAKRLGPA